MKHTILTIAFLVPAFAFAGEGTDPTDYHMTNNTGVRNLTVPSGDVTNFTGKFTTPENMTKTLTFDGGGTAVLNNPENTMACKVVANPAYVRFDAAGSSGSGVLSMAGDSSSSTPKQFQFNAEGATFPNKLEMTGTKTNSGYEYAPFKFLKSCTLSGDIVNTSTKYMQIIDDPLERPTVVFTGGISSSKATITLSPSGIFKIEGAMSLQGQQLSLVETSAPVGGAVELWNPANAISTVNIQHQSLKLMAADVITNATIYLGSVEATYSGTEGVADIMIAADQHIAGFTSSTHVRDMTAGVVRATDAATLTIGGIANGDCRFAFAGPLSIVFAGGEGLRQEFNYRSSSMTGSITVSNGTFHVGSSAKFPDVSEVDVEGGLLSIESTANCFASATKLKVANGAQLLIYNDATTPFTNELMKVEIGASGKIESSGDVSLTIPANGLSIGGVELPKGTYSSATHPDNIGEGITIKCNKKSGLIVIFR